MFKENQIKLIIDPRIELLGVVQYLSNYGENFPLVSKEQNCYTARIKEYFKEFQNHPVIRLFEQMAVKGFNYDAPFQTVLNLSNPPELKLKNELCEQLIERGCGISKVTEFINELREFAIKSNFMGFYNENLNLYEEQKNKINFAMIKEHIGFVVDYYRMGIDSNINFIISLLTCGNYGIKIDNTDTMDDMNVIFGMSHIINEPSKCGIDLSLLWHELSHSYANPLVDEYINEFIKYDYAIEKLSEKVQDSAYDNWLPVIYEYLVRAVTTRIGYVKFGNDIGQKLLEHEKLQGFVYLELFTDKLKIFEENVDKYPSFNDFIFEIIDIFKSFSK